MKQFKKILFSVAAIAFVPSIASANSWVCQITPSSDSGWISPAVVVQQSNGKYLVADTVLLDLEKAPMQAKLQIDNSRKKVFAWSFIHTNSRGQNALLRYSLSIRKSDGKASFTMRPADYKNNFLGRGKCEERPNDPNLERAIRRALESQS